MDGKYEKFVIENVESLKQPTVFFYLKQHKFSENYIKNLRKSGSAILLNSSAATVRAKIKNGDVLELLKNPNRATDIAFCDEPLNILFEDDDFLIVNKPHNLSCMPNRSHYGRNLGGMVCAYMQKRDPNFVLRIINRLDKETAGIVVIAKNVLAANNIEISKEYHALCQGNLEGNFTIDQPILTVTENGINQMRRIISPSGKRAITHVEVVKNYSGFCHIKLSLETGRTHQIRVHLSSIGHALLGDSLYREKSTPSQPPHTMLVLKKITFLHFRTKEQVVLEIPFPDDWQKFFRGLLKKHNKK